MIATLPHVPPGLSLSGGLRRLIAEDETLASRIFRNEDITGIIAKSVSMDTLRLEKITATEARLEKAGLSNTEISSSDLIAVVMPEASWRRVRVASSRCSGIQLHAGTLKDVTFTDCKLNLANFRLSKLTNVRFTDCVLDEADFYAAELYNVVFQNCTMHNTVFSGAKLKKVDLRSSDISTISGVGSLAGAVISSVQLVALAPLLASQLHITVQDD